MLKLLHTSDWHLGRRLYGKPRYDEFAKFLNWQLKVIEQYQIDILLIAGDIFDTNTPSNQAQQLYYHFLSQINKTPCRHVIIVAGNHDSPSFLDAPKTLLKQFDIHIVGSISENLADEVLLLNDPNGNPEMLIMAIPYLKDRDVRQVGGGETLDDKEQKLVNGIHNHYQQVAEIAKQMQANIQQQHNRHIPIVATGHLFTIGGKTIDGDGVRDLYVGSLAHVTTDIFDPCIDYVALGHLHIPQKVGKTEHIRYSGSPIAMGFGEAKQQKQVNLIQFQKKSPAPPQIDAINVPIFQQLSVIRGDWQTIEKHIQHLKKQPASIWLEIIYEGKTMMSDLKEQLNHLINDSPLEILRLKNLQRQQQTLQTHHTSEILEELDEKQVFERCLTAHQIPVEQQKHLRQRYYDVLQQLQNDKI